MKLLGVNGGWREGEVGGPRQLAVRSTAYCLVNSDHPYTLVGGHEG